MRILAGIKCYLFGDRHQKIHVLVLFAFRKERAAWTQILSYFQSLLSLNKQLKGEQRQPTTRLEGGRSRRR